MFSLKQFNPKILHGNGKILEVLEEMFIAVLKMLRSFCRKIFFLRWTPNGLETDFYPSLPHFVGVDADAVYFHMGLVLLTIFK